MDVMKAVTTRRSIRKFKADAVPESLIREILEAARWSPSWGNTQPWEIVVVTGEKLEKFKNANQQLQREGALPQPDTTMPATWPEAIKQRYNDIGKRVLTALNIPRGDKEARQRYYSDMATLFGAPAMLLFCLDKEIAREYGMLDIGAILQTTCLLAHDRGLGTCILSATVLYPSMVREIIPLPSSKAIIMGAALGYPAAGTPVNEFERERAPLDSVTLWVK
ncbi:MAG: nitroreductase [Syntrophales bacterium]|jgi:nitroreductase|nr:nitroreductase [Syntrophales bacterium]